MIKIQYLMFVALLAQMTSYTVTDIEKYIERMSRVEDTKQDWVFELKNKDKESYLLTIVNGMKVIADGLSVLSAKGSSDSSLGYIRISSVTGFKPSIEPTYILLEGKKTKSAHAWYIKPGASKIFVSYQNGNLAVQRSGLLQGLYASYTTSKLPLKGNVSSIQKADVEDVRKIVNGYKNQFRVR